MPRISLATVVSNANASRMIGRVGPDDELIVVVGMGLVELLAPARRCRAGRAARIARRRLPLPPAVGPCVAQVDGRKSPVCPGESPTTASRER